jgi:hypothetical protein
MDSHIITVTHHLHLVVPTLEELWGDSAALRMLHITAYNLKIMSRIRKYNLIHRIAKCFRNCYLSWRMSSSGMLRRAALVRTDISVELSASFIRVTRISELGTTLAVTSNRRMLRRNTKCTVTRATRHKIPRDAIFHSHRSENLKSYMLS